MGLFIISFFFVFASSYLLTSVLSPKKSPLGFNYLFLIAFAQIVLTFEVLSLFSAIKPFWVIVFNVIFFLASAFIWNKKARPLWSVDFKSFKSRVKNSFKLDKTLGVLFFGLCVFLVSAVILCLIMPISSIDALAYHAARSVFWVVNGNLNHFDVADVRNLCLPINSEILYSWVLLFFKKDVLFGFFAFVGYILSIFSIYNILSLLGFSTRKKLWVIFILSSFSSVIVQASGTETDIIIAGLIASSIFLFWHSLKFEEKTPLVMSALAYALAVGTKTTAIIAIPAVGLLFLTLSISFKQKDFYKPLLTFLGAVLLGFLVFSSYNYILNYIEFKNIFGNQSLMEVSKNFYGIKAIPANFIKYIFLFFDFTGFKWSEYVGHDILQLRDGILTALGLGDIPDGLYSMRTMPNRTLIEPLMGAGILGFLVFIPCLVCALVKPVFKKSKKTWLIFAFAGMFIVNLLTMSYLLSFMVFSIRFIMTFMVLSSPILVYSYLKSKNPLKYVIVFFSLFYLMAVSTHIWARPLNKIIPILTKTHSISELRRRTKCTDFEKDPRYRSDTCILVEKIKKEYSTQNRILGFFSTDDNMYLIKELAFDGYNIDFGLLERAEDIDFDKYNIIIFPSTGQRATYFKDYEKRKNEFAFRNGELVIVKKRPVMCLYSPNPVNPPTKDGEDRAPYKVLCGMSEEFLNTKSLKPFAAAGIVNSKAKEPTYYLIYRNTKLPLYLKKKK